MSSHYSNNYFKYHHASTKDNTNLYLRSCEEGNLEIIQYLDSSINVHHKPDLIKFDNRSNAWQVNHGAVISAIRYGHINILQYLYDMPLYRDKIFNKENNMTDFISLAGNYNQLHIVEFLLDCPSLLSLEKADYLISWALNDKCFPLFHLLTTHSKKFDLKMNDYFLFKEVCDDYLRSSNEQYIHHCVFDINLELNDSIMTWLNGDNDFDVIYTDVLNIIDKKKLYEQLDKNTNQVESMNMIKSKQKI